MSRSYRVRRLATPSGARRRVVARSTAAARYSFTRSVDRAEAPSTEYGMLQSEELAATPPLTAHPLIRHSAGGPPHARSRNDISRLSVPKSRCSRTFIPTPSTHCWTGSAPSRDLVARAKALGQDALAITDHGNLHGALQFYEEARANGIKPIIGLEGYVAPGSRFDRGAASRTPFHLTLLAQNETGYRNLLKLSTASHLEGFYYRPRVDRELLEQHNEGLIALSACPSGEVRTALKEEREPDAREALGWYSDVFRDRYYVELQEHGQEKFSPPQPAARLARARPRSAAGADQRLALHRRAEQEHRAHEVLLCIGTQLAPSTTRARLKPQRRHVLPALRGGDAHAVARRCQRPADNTCAHRRGRPTSNSRLRAARLLPDPGMSPSGMTARRVPAATSASKASERRYHASRPRSSWERLRYEFERRSPQTGFDEYMLIVRRPRAVRARAAASRWAYEAPPPPRSCSTALDVTDIEPTAAQRLVFERFLNPERHRACRMWTSTSPTTAARKSFATPPRSYGRDRVAQIVHLRDARRQGRHSRHRARPRDGLRARPTALRGMVPDSAQYRPRRRALHAGRRSCATRYDEEDASVQRAGRHRAPASRASSRHSSDACRRRRDHARTARQCRPAPARDLATAMPTSRLAAHDAVRHGRRSRSSKPPEGRLPRP